MGNGIPVIILLEGILEGPAVNDFGIVRHLIGRFSAPNEPGIWRAGCGAQR